MEPPRWQINHKKNLLKRSEQTRKKEKRFIDQEPRGNNSNFDKFHNIADFKSCRAVKDPRKADPRRTLGISQ